MVTKQKNVVKRIRKNRHLIDPVIADMDCDDDDGFDSKEMYKYESDFTEEEKRCKNAFNKADKLSQLMALLATSKNVEQKTKVMSELCAKFGDRVGWASLGNNNNIAVTQSGSKLIAALVERYTNGEDGIIDLLFEAVFGKWDDNFNASTCKNPKEQPFKNPKEASDFLLNPKNLPSKWADFVNRMKDSQGFIKLIQYKDAFECRDVGCGMNKEVFTKQFLSYHSEGKAKKYHQKGQFSQGGMQSLGFTEEGTIVFSKTPDNDMCVVSMIELKKAQDAYNIDSYKYLTIDGEVFCVHIDVIMHAENNTHPEEIKNTDYMINKFRMTSENFPHGTSVRHIKPRGIENFSSLLGGVRTSFYRAFNLYMPIPTISARIEIRDPFYKDEIRKKNQMSRPIFGVIAGLHKRNKGKGTKHFVNEHHCPKLNGNQYSIDIIAINPGDNKDGVEKANPGDMMFPKNQTMIVSLGGQTHALQGIGAIKTELGLGMIDWLFIHINLNGLAVNDLRCLLTSNRESLRDCPQQESIMNDLKTILKESSSINDLQERMMTESIKKSSTSVDEKMKKIMSKFINWTKGVMAGTSGSSPGVGTCIVRGDGTENGPTDNRHREPKKLEPIITSNNPTYIKFANKKDIKICNDRSSYWIKIETDASDKFHDTDNTNKSCIRFTEYDGGVVSIGGTTSLINGRMSVQVNPVKNGTGSICVELFKSSRKLAADLICSTVATVEVIEAIEKKEKSKRGLGKFKKGTGPIPNHMPNVNYCWISPGDIGWNFINRNGDIYKANYHAEWTNKEKDTIVIYISAINSVFCEHKKSISSELWQNMFKMYVEAGLFMISHNQLVQRDNFIQQKGIDSNKNLLEDLALSNEIIFESVLMNSSLHVQAQQEIAKLKKKQ